MIFMGTTLISLGFDGCRWQADWKDKLKIEVTKAAANWIFEAVPQVREMPQGDPKSPKGKAPEKAVLMAPFCFLTRFLKGLKWI